MIKYLLAIVFNLSCIFCMAQETVTFDKKFEDFKADEIVDTIEVPDTRNAFEIQIIQPSDITAIQLKKFAKVDDLDLPENFDSTRLGKRILLVNGFKYDGLNAKPDKDGFIKVLIFKDKASKTVKIKVNKKKPGDDDCSFVVSAKPDCATPTYADTFGITRQDLGKKEVIYVYDNNKLTAKRRFYKISYERNWFLGERKFGIRNVNFSKENLTPNKQVYIRLVNVNLFVNDVAINDSLVDYFSEPSPLINRLFIPDTAAQGTLLRKFETRLQGNDELDAVKDSLECFNSMYTQMEAAALKAYDPCEVFFCCNEIDFAKIKSKLNAVNSAINRIKLLAVAKKTELDKLKKDKEDCEKKAATPEVKKLNEEIKKLKDTIAAFNMITNRSKTQDSLLAKKEDTLKTKNGELSKIICSEEIRTQIATIPDLEDFLKTTEILTEIQKALPAKEDLNRLAVFLANIVDQNQNYTKLPIQLRGNRLDFNVKIYSIDSIVKRFGFPARHDSAYYQIPILWKPFVSFSTGSFIALSKNLQNKTYTWQAGTGPNNTIDSSKFTLVESAYTLHPSGFAALANIELKMSRSLGVGLSAGVGLTLETDPRLAYLAGGSLFLGDLRQFALTCGFAGMQVERLTNNFQTMANNQVISAGRPSIQTYKELKVGGFVSLTYTPFVTKRNK